MGVRHYGLPHTQTLFVSSEADGRQLLILISDSQNQYRGVLRDWFKTIVMD